MALAYLLLGSNEGDRRQAINTAITSISKLQLTTLLRSSSWYETAAWGKLNLPPHINVALEIDTQLKPIELLDQILAIETNIGRIRQEKWGQRIIDIDIIFYENDIIRQQRLQIPHLLLQARRFVLTPLAELIPSYLHPISGLSVLELLAQCQDELPVHKIEK